MALGNMREQGVHHLIAFTPQPSVPAFSVDPLARPDVQPLPIPRSSSASISVRRWGIEPNVPISGIRLSDWLRRSWDHRH
jgi:hypothetical protein